MAIVDADIIGLISSMRVHFNMAYILATVVVISMLVVMASAMRSADQRNLRHKLLFKVQPKHSYSITCITVSSHIEILQALQVARSSPTGTQDIGGIHGGI